MPAAGKGKMRLRSYTLAPLVLCCGRSYVCCMYVVFLLWGDVYCASGERKAQERKYVSMFVVCLSVVCLSVFCILYSVCMHVRMYVVCMYCVRCERKDVCILPGARSLTVRPPPPSREMCQTSIGRSSSRCLTSLTASGDSSAHLPTRSTRAGSFTTQIFPSAASTLSRSRSPRRTRQPKACTLPSP